jgi:hypothetical protein
MKERSNLLSSTTYNIKLMPYAKIPKSVINERFMFTMGTVQSTFAFAELPDLISVDPTTADKT